MTVVDLYTVQIIRDGVRIFNFDELRLDATMAETEENLTDLLPAGYRARIRRWNEPDEEGDDE